MTASEHSTLIYLFDAIEVAPKRWPDLLKAAGKKNASESYRDVLSQLREAAQIGELLVRSRRIRQGLR